MSDETTTLREQVAAFQAMIGRDAPEVPTVPSAATVRLRLALILEEAFETLRAAIPGKWDDADRLMHTLRLTPDSAVRVDMAAFADGLADLDFVIEGTRQEFGINGAPIAAAVYEANMRKLGGPKDANGKHLKPKGWTPPDIEGELRKQGWQP